MKKIFRKKQGFTIVELVIVIAVIGILSAILIPTITNLVSKSKSAALQSDLVNAYKMYQVDAIDGYAGDEDELNDTEKETKLMRNISQDLVFLCEEKNAESAKEAESYHYEGGKWVRGTPNKLISVCKSADYNADKYGRFYVFYEEAALESITLNPSNFELRPGMSIDMNAIPNPKNSVVEDPVWESDNACVTIDENGTMNAVSAGSATITVTSGTVSASTTITVSGEEVGAEDIVSVNPPSFVDEFNANKSNADSLSVIDAPSSRVKSAVKKSSRNTYFSYDLTDPDDAAKATYKVGHRNSFIFDYSGNMNLVGELKELKAYVRNPKIVPTLKYKATGSAVESSRATVVGNTVQFGVDAAELDGQVLVLTLHNSHLTYTFEFEVFDGYNVYRPEELVWFDNRDATAGKLVFDTEVTSEPSDDPWAGLRFGVSSEDVHGIALHRNLKLKSSHIAEPLKYTAAQAEAYASTYPIDYKAWTTSWQSRMNALFGSDYKYTFNGIAELTDSFREARAGIYYRSTNETDDFKFEGNYFAIDFSSLKPAYGVNNSYGDVKHHDVVGEGVLSHSSLESHSGLFAFNTVNNKAVGSNSLPTRNGINSFTNLTLKGNGALSNDQRKAVSLIGFKSVATEVDFTNVVAANMYTTYMNEINWEIMNVKESSAFIYDDHDSNLDNDSPQGKFYLDRCKCFSNYNIAYYARGTVFNEIKNSIFEDAGGPLIMNEEANYHQFKKYTEGNGDYRFHHTSHVDVIHSHMENWVQGTESWFVQYNATALIAPIVAMGKESGWLGRNSLNFGEHKSIVKKVPALNSYIFNFVGLDFGGAASYSLTKGKQLEGAITIKDNPSSEAFALDMTRVQNQLPAMYNNTFYGESQGFIVETSAGGHGAMIDPNGRDGATLLGAPINNPLVYFNPLVVDEDTTIPTMDQVIAMYSPDPTSGPVVAALLNGARDNLASGDYASLYVKADGSNNVYIGLLLGMTRL